MAWAPECELLVVIRHFLDKEHATIPCDGLKRVQRAVGAYLKKTGRQDDLWTRTIAGAVVHETPVAVLVSALKGLAENLEERLDRQQCTMEGVEDVTLDDDDVPSITGAQTAQAAQAQQLLPNLVPVHLPQLAPPAPPPPNDDDDDEDFPLPLPVPPPVPPGLPEVVPTFIPPAPPGEDGPVRGAHCIGLAALRLTVKAEEGGEWSGYGFFYFTVAAGREVREVKGAYLCNGEVVRRVALGRIIDKDDALKSLNERPHKAFTVRTPVDGQMAMQTMLAAVANM